MKNIIAKLYSVILIIIGLMLFLERPEALSNITLIYVLNASFIIFLGLRELTEWNKKTVLVYQNQISIRRKGETIEKYDLKKALKISIQHNRLTIYFEGFSKHIFYKEFKKSSQKKLKEII